MLPCLALSTVRWGSWVKWRNPGNGIAPSPTSRCSSYWKGSLRVTLVKGRQLYFYLYWPITSHDRKLSTSASRYSTGSSLWAAAHTRHPTTCWHSCDWPLSSSRKVRLTQDSLYLRWAFAYIIFEHPYTSFQPRDCFNSSAHMHTVQSTAPADRWIQNFRKDATVFFINYI